MNRSSKLLANVTQIVSFTGNGKKLTTAIALGLSKEIMAKDYLRDISILAEIKTHLTLLAKHCEDKAGLA